MQALSPSSYPARPSPMFPVASLFVIIFLLAWAFFYPALNWPDEAYKVEQIGFDRNPFLWMTYHLGGGQCSILYSHDRTGGYLSGGFQVQLWQGHACYYALKSTVIALGVVILGSCLMVLRNTAQRELFMLSLLWPASLFALSGINQHVVFHLLATMIVVRVLYTDRVWPALLVAIACVPLDRSFVTLIVFLGVLMAVRWRPRLTVLSLPLVIAAVFMLRSYIGASTLLLGGTQSIADITESLQRFSDAPHESIALLIISAVYLGGTNSVFGFGPDYLIVGGSLAYLIYQNRANIHLRNYMVAFLASYFIVISFVPTIQTFRYYAFVVPVVIYFLLPHPRQRVLYLLFCLVMTPAYLFSAVAQNV